MMTPERNPSHDEMEDEPIMGTGPVPDTSLDGPVPIMDVADLENQSLLNDDTTLGPSVIDVSATINNSVNASMTSENCKIIDESDVHHSPCPDPDGTPAVDMNMNQVMLEGTDIIPDAANLTPVKLDAGLKEQDTFTSSPTNSRDLHLERKEDEADARPLSRRQQRMRIVKCYGLVAVIVLICAIGIPLGAVMLFKNQNNETSFAGAADNANDPSTPTTTSTTSTTTTTTPSDMLPPDESTTPPFDEETTTTPFHEESENTKAPEWVNDEDGDTDAPDTWQETATTEPEEVDTEPPVVVTEPPVVITDPPVVITDAPLPETNIPILISNTVPPAMITTDSPPVVAANLTNPVGERNVTSDAADPDADGFADVDETVAPTTGVPAQVDVPEAEVVTETEEPTEEGTTFNPTGNPTFAPTGTPTFRATPPPTIARTPGPDRSAIYFDLINVTSPAILQDTASPQALSYLWLVEQDQILPVPSGPKAIQRYVLNVMDHVLHDPVRPILSNPTKDECEWIGVVCNNVTGEVTEINWLRQGLNGGLVAEMKHLTSLERLDLSENELKGTLDHLYPTTSLKYVYLHDNQFSGPLSEQVGMMEALDSLYLGHNELTGQLPISLRSPRGQAKPLRWLILSHNKFSGYLPPDWRMRNVFHLDLGHNNFQGPLPSDWENNMVRLRHLYLDHNGFTGTIPQNFVRLGNGRIKQIHLNNNNLTGTVPVGFDPVDQLTSISLQGNAFTTPIDPALCMLSVFELGVMVEMRSDCDICTCDMLCRSCQE